MEGSHSSAAASAAASPAATAGAAAQELAAQQLAARVGNPLLLRALLVASRPLRSLVAWQLMLGRTLRQLAAAAARGLLLVVGWLYGRVSQRGGLARFERRYFAPRRWHVLLGKLQRRVVGLFISFAQRLTACALLRTPVQPVPSKAQTGGLVYMGKRMRLWHMVQKNTQLTPVPMTCRVAPGGAAGAVGGAAVAGVGERQAPAAAGAAGAHAHR